MKQTLDTKKVKNVSVTDRVMVYCICVLVLCLGVMFFIFEKKDFSDSENRYLAKFPDLKLDNITGGDFTEDLGTYVADHFPLRDSFLSIMTETERLSGRKQINDVYLAKDGSLIEEYEEPENTDKQIEQFSKLADNLQDKKCYLMMVPTAVSICSDNLPDNTPASASQDRIIDRIYSEVSDKITTIDTASVLKSEWDADKDNRLYYRTDHHWTTYGAYAGYKAYCEETGFSAIPLSDYTATTVSENFRGTIYSKLNDPYFGADEIVSYSYPKWKLEVEYSDTGEVTDTLYNSKYLKERDQYSYFLNNIHPMVTITNNAVTEDKALALVKDSYANSIVPFLAAHYHKIYVFDTRYYKGGPSSFINEHSDITDVLILYNLGTIDSDTGIGGIY